MLIVTETSLSNFTDHILASLEIKELEQMLEDPNNSEEDTDLIASTLQRFRKNENSFQVQYAQVVGKSNGCGCS